MRPVIHDDSEWRCTTCLFHAIGKHERDIHVKYHESKLQRVEMKKVVRY